MTPTELAQAYNALREKWAVEQVFPGPMPESVRKKFDAMADRIRAEAESSLAAGEVVSEEDVIWRLIEEAARWGGESIKRQINRDFAALPPLPVPQDVPEVVDTRRRHNGRLVTDDGYVICAGCNCYDYTDCSGAEFHAELALPDSPAEAAE